MSESEAMSATDDCGGDAAAYALGALEPAEAENFRRHLEHCAVCRDEVDALQGVVQALPMASPQYRPPRALRRRVLRTVDNEPMPGTRRKRWAGWSWSSRRRAVAGLAAGLAAAAGVIAGIELSATGGPSRVIQAELAGVSGSAELRVTRGHGELVVRDLSPPPAGHVYEVWLKPGGSKPVPASVLFTVSPNGSADVGLPRSLRGISQVMVTPEPDGGSPAPTHSPVIVVHVT